MPLILAPLPDMLRCKAVVRLLMVLCLGSLLQACSGWLFYPQKHWQMPEEVGAYDYQSLSLPMSDGIVLDALLMPARQARKGAILYFHGNSENISVHVRQVFWLADHGYDVVLVDYRGYGRSGGEVDLHKNISDIAEVAEWFVAHYSGPRFMIAHSLGASMSGYVMATRPDLRSHFSALVLDAGFAGYRRIMRDVMSQNCLLSLLRYPASMGMPDDYDLLEVIERIAPTPLLIIHGRQDHIVPYQHGIDLYGKALAPKVLLSYPGYHVDGLADPLRRQMVLEFMQTYAPQPLP